MELKNRAKEKIELYEVLKIILRSKVYSALFTVSFILFLLVYLIAWNPKDALSYPLSYVQIFKSNALSLLSFSLLSAIIITLLIFSLDARIKSSRAKYSLFSIVPAFLISSSQCCPPLIFSLSSATLSFGLSLVGISKYIKIASFLAMIATLFYLSQTVSNQMKKCEF